MQNGFFLWSLAAVLHSYKLNIQSQVQYLKRQLLTQLNSQAIPLLTIASWIERTSGCRHRSAPECWWHKLISLLSAIHSLFLYHFNCSLLLKKHAEPPLQTRVMFPYNNVLLIDKQGPTTELQKFLFSKTSCGLGQNVHDLAASAVEVVGNLI